MDPAAPADQMLGWTHEAISSSPGRNGDAFGFAPWSLSDRSVVTDVGESGARVPMLSFLGAIGTVTGSKFMIDTPDQRVLVDCGQYQGHKDLRQRNWRGIGVGAASVDAVVLTHAHLDHCGLLPALVRDGFAGPIYCTPGTASLTRIILPDAGRLAEEEARYANRKGYSKHEPALPLFTEDDAERALTSLVEVPFGKEHGGGGWSFHFGRSGHILGSAWARIALHGPEERSLVFTGDLGRSNHPLLVPPDPRPPVDVVVTESTYGSRDHEPGDPAADLAAIIRRTAERDGTVIIPSFAVDRTDIVLALLRRLIETRAIPAIPVWLDSPMASAALSVYRDAFESGSPDVRPELVGTDPFGVPGLKTIRTVEESKALNDVAGPMIIISASGMLTGGRVIHHVVRRIGDHRNTVVLIGYQAESTRGRRLAEGATTLKMLGRYWPVKAEITHVPNMSVHADRHDLLAWLASCPEAPEMVYAVHGEPESSAGLVDAISRQLRWSAVVPTLGERVRLDTSH